MPPKFTHLHVHSHYSLLDGLPKISQLLDHAKKLGMDSLALTDHGVLYGAVEFYKAAKERGIKPIIGMEGYIAPHGMSVKQQTADDKRAYHITLLARNNAGYQNLIKISTKAHLEGFYYKPRADKELLKKHADGLIALSGCLASETSRHILANNLPAAKKAIREYQEIFGPDFFYLEVQHHANIPEQKLVNEALYALSRELGAPLVATQDSHYLHSDDAEAQDILLGINTGSALDEAGRLTMREDDFSLRPPELMAELFADHPSAIENTEKITDMCNVELKLGVYQLPRFDVPAGYDENSYLTKLCHEGLERRYGTRAPEDSQVLERLQYELDVIKETGFASYFLIVQDFVNWAKQNNIIVGPGRGSAAGSIVSYLLNITNIDPLAYNLLFERFLNKDRVSMPDIDLDFADTRRDEVIKYVAQKYGDDHVAQIITFGTMAARAVVRDVGRVLGYAYGYCDKLAKMIPMQCDLREALENVNEFRQFYETDAQAKRLIDIAKKLEGVARHASTHACGVVITKESIDEIVPRQHPSQDPNLIVTQYEMHSIEDLGLLKIDFLGLKNLTTIEDALKQIARRYGKTINIEQLPLEDEQTFKLLQDGHTVGVFQLESDGMTRYLKELKPTHLEDIIAMVALYRPGPMELIPDFVARKHGIKKISYLHPKLEPILSNTYGIAVYQEQVLQIARDISGFTFSEADVLRKAIGKKIRGLLEEQKEKFEQGAIRNGIEKRIAEQLFQFVEPFARYGFNRAHATCYALIAYQTAYLKTHYPVEFMAALLGADQKHIERVAFFINECKRMGIRVLPPDINESEETFTVVSPPDSQKDRTIRFGLAAIKNVGTGIVEELIKERELRGAYKSIEDLLERVAGKDFNKKSLESLIKAGALDAFGDRGAFLAHIDMLLQYGRERRRASESGQESLFAETPQLMQSALTLPPVPKTEKHTELNWEKELLGLYLSGHPLEAYKEKLGAFSPISAIIKKMNNSTVRLAGVIQSIQKIITRTGKPMLFVVIEDLSGRIEALVFPDLLEKNKELIAENKVLSMRGRLSDKDGTPKLLCDTIEEI